MLTLWWYLSGLADAAQEWHGAKMQCWSQGVKAKEKKGAGNFMQFLLRDWTSKHVAISLFLFEYLGKKKSWFRLVGREQEGKNRKTKKAAQN